MSASCSDVRELLSAFVDGESGDDEASIRAHLDACDACERERAEIARAVELVAALPRVRAPVGFAASVLAALDEEPAATTSAPAATDAALATPAIRVVGGADAASTSSASGAPSVARPATGSPMAGLRSFAAAAVALLAVGLGFAVLTGPDRGGAPDRMAIHYVPPGERDEAASRSSETRDPTDEVAGTSTKEQEPLEKRVDEQKDNEARLSGFSLDDEDGDDGAGDASAGEADGARPVDAVRAEAARLAQRERRANKEREAADRPESSNGAPGGDGTGGGPGGGGAPAPGVRPSRTPPPIESPVPSPDMDGAPSGPESAMKRFDDFKPSGGEEQPASGRRYRDGGTPAGDPEPTPMPEPVDKTRFGADARQPAAGAMAGRGARGDGTSEGSSDDGGGASDAPDAGGQSGGHGRELGGGGGAAPPTPAPAPRSTPTPTRPDAPTSRPAPSAEGGESGGDSYDGAPAFDGGESGEKNDLLDRDRSKTEEGAKSKAKKAEALARALREVEKSGARDEELQDGAMAQAFGEAERKRVVERGAEPKKPSSTATPAKGRLDAEEALAAGKANRKQTEASAQALRAAREEPSERAEKLAGQGGREADRQPRQQGQQQGRWAAERGEDEDGRDDLVVLSVEAGDADAALLALVSSFEDDASNQTWGRNAVTPRRRGRVTAVDRARESGSGSADDDATDPGDGSEADERRDGIGGKDAPGGSAAGADSAAPEGEDDAETEPAKPLLPLLPLEPPSASDPAERGESGAETRVVTLELDEDQYAALLQRASSSGWFYRVDRGAAGEEQLAGLGEATDAPEKVLDELSEGRRGLGEARGFAPGAGGGSTPEAAGEASPGPVGGAGAVAPNTNTERPKNTDPNAAPLVEEPPAPPGDGEAPKEGTADEADRPTEPAGKKAPTSTRRIRVTIVVRAPK